MAKSRILWGLELILCVLFYVFADSYAGLWPLAIHCAPIVEMIGQRFVQKKLGRYYKKSYLCQKNL